MRLLLVICALAIGGVNAAVGDADAAVQRPSKCMESDPCWSWSQMGNRKRVAVVLVRTIQWDPATGDARIVSSLLTTTVRACGFRRYQEAGRLWWSGGIMKHLHGDGWAMQNGCK